MQTLSGIVIKGDQRGKALGYPTANLQVTSGDLPQPGIHAAWVVLGEERYPAAVSYGSNPTFGMNRNLTLEVHILDFNADIYGRELTLELVTYLRPEIAFNSITDLQSQMAEDCAKVTKALSAAAAA